MKKANQKKKKKRSSSKRDAATKRKPGLNLDAKPSQSAQVEPKPARSIQRGALESKQAATGFIPRVINKTGQFLREAKTELKKVKWPTRKELLASTAVVIVLTLIVAFFLGLVDFGLIKIIKNVVG